MFWKDRLRGGTDASHNTPVRPTIAGNRRKAAETIPTLKSPLKHPLTHPLSQQKSADRDKHNTIHNTMYSMANAGVVRLGAEGGFTLKRFHLPSRRTVKTALTSDFPQVVTSGTEGGAFRYGRWCV